MADTLNIIETVIFNQQTPPQSFRLLDAELSNIPVSYSHGKITIPAGTENYIIGLDSNICILRCAASTFTVKVGNTTNPAMTLMKLFNYYGSKTNFYVSNPLTEDIILDTVVSSY